MNFLIIDIHSEKPWPSCKLSNFSDTPFTLDGRQFCCMEGFLQSLKEADDVKSAEYSQLRGREAKSRGSGLNWQEKGLLYWKGKAIDRYGDRYRELVGRAYDALVSQNPDFAEALLATGHRILWHRIGKLRRKSTCLTTFEFISQLRRKRAQLRKEKRSADHGRK